MARRDIPPVLVTGATGRLGRVVVDLLVDGGVPVRALTRGAEAAETLPPGVDVVAGDFTVPESLDAGLRGVGAVFLAWTAPPATAPAVIERPATHTRRIVLLSAPHRAPHPFFQQPNPDGGALRGDRATHRGCGARVDDHPAGNVRLERVELVGTRDPLRRRRLVAPRCGRDRTDR